MLAPPLYSFPNVTFSIFNVGLGIRDVQRGKIARHCLRDFFRCVQQTWPGFGLDLFQGQLGSLQRTFQGSFPIGPLGEISH